MAVKVTRDNLLDLLQDSTNALKQQSAVRQQENEPFMQSPQSTGGSVSSAPKTTAPVTDRGYDSPRTTDYGNVANGNAKRSSLLELSTAPRSYVSNFESAVEDIARSPFSQAAYKLATRDKAMSKREEEGSESIQNARQTYLDRSKERRLATAEKLGKIADSIKLYNPENVLTRREDEMISSSERLGNIAKEDASKRMSVYDFIEDTNKRLQKVEEEIGSKYTLAHAAGVAGAMAPAQIIAAITGSVISDYASGSGLGQAISYNLGERADLGAVAASAIKPITSVDDLIGVAEGVTAAQNAARVAKGASELQKTVQTVASLSTMWGSVYGENWDEARAMGLDVVKAGDYATSKAFAEVLPEILGGGIPGMGGGAGTRIVQNIANQTAERFGGKAVGKVLPYALTSVANFMSSDIGEMAVDIFGEGVEEMITEAYTPVVLRNTIDPDAPNATWGEILTAGFTGAVQSLFMSGMNSAIRDAKNERSAYVLNAIEDEKGRIREKIEKMSAEELYNEVFGEEDGTAGIDEAVQAGVYTAEDLADLANRATRAVYLNKLATTPGLDVGQRAFRAGGKMYEQYKNIFSEELLDYAKTDGANLAIKARMGRLLSIAEAVPSNEELDSFASELKLAFDAVAKGAAIDSSVPLRLQSPTNVGFTADMFSDKAKSIIERQGSSVEDFAETVDYAIRSGDHTLRDYISGGVADAERVYDSILKEYGEDGLRQAYNVASEEDRQALKADYDDYKARIQERRKHLTTDTVSVEFEDGTERRVSFPELLDIIAQSAGLESGEQLDEVSIKEAEELFNRELESRNVEAGGVSNAFQLRNNWDAVSYRNFTPEEETEKSYAGGATRRHPNGDIELILNKSITYSRAASISNLTHEGQHAFVKELNRVDPTGKSLEEYDARLIKIAETIGIDVDAMKKDLKALYAEHPDVGQDIDDEFRSNILQLLLGDSTLFLDMSNNDLSFMNDILDVIEDRIRLKDREGGFGSKAEKIAAKTSTEETRSAINGSLPERNEDQNTRTVAAIPESVKESAKQAKEDTPNTTDAADEAIRLAENETPATSAKDAEEKAANNTPIAEVFERKSIVLPEIAKKLGFKTSVDDQKKASKATKKKKVGNTEVSYADDITRVELAGLPGVYVRVNQQTHKNGDVTRNLVAEADSAHPLAKDGKTRLFDSREADILHALGFKARRGVWLANYNQRLWDSMLSGNAEALRKGKRTAPKNDIGDLHWYKTNRNDGSEVAWIPGKNGGQGELVLIFRNDKGFRRRANKEEYYRYVGGERKGIIAPGLGFERRTNGEYGNALYAPCTEELWQGFGLDPMTPGMRSKMNEMTQIRRAMFAMDGRVDCQVKGLEGFSIGYNSLNNTLELYAPDGSRVGITDYSEGIIEAALNDSELTEIFAERSKDLKKLYDEAEERGRQARWGYTSPELEKKADERAAEKGSAFATAEPEAVQRSIERQLAKANGKDVIWVKFRDSDEWQVFPRGVANELVGVSTGGKLKTTGDEYNGEKIYGAFIDPEYIDQMPDDVRIDAATGMPRQLQAADVIEFVKDADGNMVWDASGYDPETFYKSDQRSAEPNQPYEGIQIHTDWFKDNKIYAEAYERDLTSGIKKTKNQSKTETTDIEEIFSSEKEKQEKAEKAAEETTHRATEEGSDVEAPSGVTAEEYGERLGGVLGELRSKGIAPEGSQNEGDTDVDYFDRAEAEYSEGMYEEEESGEGKYKEKQKAKRDIFKDADEGARALMEAFAQEEVERKGTGTVIRPLYSYSMDEARALCKGDSDEVILARMEISKTTEKMREAAAEKDWEVFKALKDKRDEQTKLLETLRSLPTKPKVKSTGKIELKDIIKPKSKNARKNAETELGESKPFSAETVEEGYAGSGELGVGLDTAYGDYDAGALSEPVFNDGLVNSEGYPLRQDQKDIFNTMPGSLAPDGSVQVYYTNYIDSDGTDYGDGAFVLSTDPSAFEEQSEAVYAAIRNPLFAETSKVSAYPNIRKTVMEALDYLGIDPKSVKLPQFRKEANVFDIIKVAADRASEISGMNRSTIIGEILLQTGVDGVVFPDGAIVYDIEQLHEAYPTSEESMGVRGYNYKNDGSIMASINMSTNETIRSIRDRVNELSAKREEYEKRYGKEAYKESVKNANEKAKEKYGTIDNKGAIPKQNTEGNRRNSKAAQTLWEALQFDQEETPLTNAYEELVASGILSYVPEADAVKMARAREWLQSFAKGTVENPNELTTEDFATACSQWIKNAENASLDENGVLQGAQLLAEFASYARANKDNPDAFSRGMINAFQKVAALLDMNQSKAGKVLRASRLLKNMSAQGKLYYYEHMASRLADELDKAKGILRKNLKTHELKGYKVPEELVKRLMDIQPGEGAKQALAEVEEDIIRDIASKIPPTIESRIRAYRYLCMLGNIKTHVRNMASNAIMAGVKSVARVNSAALEDVFASKKEGEERTKSLKKWFGASRETKLAAKKFAEEDAKRSVEYLQFGGKQGFTDKIHQYAKSFGNSKVGKFLEMLSTKNSYFLEAEDLTFLSREYQAAMTWYMIANDWTPEHFYESTEQAAIDYSKAQDYALKQAWEATYRQSNILATKLNELAKNNSVAAVLIEGIVPFKRTPMNILMTGVNYSPAGLFNGLGKTFDMIRTGATSAAEAADTLGKGMSGTGIMALGGFLAHFGWLKGGGSDDKTEEYYDQMLGNQPYSFTVPDFDIGDYKFVLSGNNYTVEWLTPVSMPLFAGVEAYDAFRQMREKDETYDMRDLLNDFYDAVLSTADPVTNLSMLSSVKDIIKTASQTGSPFDIARNAAENYALQFIPTISGQAARTINPQRKTTYAPSDSKFPGGKKTEVFVNKIKNKSLLYNIADRAGLAEGNAAYIDQWGRTEDGEPNVFVRAFDQFVAPWYSREYNSTEVDDQLAKLFEANGGDTKIFPTTPNSYASIGKKTYKFNSKEYEKVKTVVGKLSYSGVDSAFKYREFNALDPSEQSDIVDKIYSYAWKMAKSDYAKSHGIQVWASDKEKKAYLAQHPGADGYVDSEVAKVKEATKAGLSIGKYYTIKALVSGLKSSEKAAKLESLGVSSSMKDLF